MITKPFIKTLLIVGVLLFISLPATPVFSGVIEGKVIDADGKAVFNAAVMLYDVDEPKANPKVMISKEDGTFRFKINDKIKEYLLVVYSDGVIQKMPIHYHGQNRDYPIEAGTKWYASKWFDKVLSFLGFLASFILGLFSREISAWIKKKKVKKIIVSIYNKSINDFLKECEKIKDIQKNEEEAVYFRIYDNFLLIRKNLNALFSSSWAVENMEVNLFSKLMKKIHIFNDMENTLPFDKTKSYSSKMDFLKDHQDPDQWPPYKKEHLEFENLLNKLKLTDW